MDHDPNHLQQIPGGSELCAGVGGTPTFADAQVLDLQIGLNGEGCLILKTCRLGPDGNYLPHEPVIVTFKLKGLSSVELIDLMEPSYVHQLVVEAHLNSTTLRWEAAYGVQGSLTAAEMRVTFVDGTAD